METLLLRQADEKRLTADVGELAELVELTTVPWKARSPNFHFARAQLGGAMRRAIQWPSHVRSWHLYQVPVITTHAPNRACRWT